jgi:hypothetical protein
LSEFQTTDGGNTLDASTENVLFKVDDPESNHNGGAIGFGPDGYLYSSIGDGGGGNDQHGTIGNGQRLTILLGKMLRIDVGSTPGAAYTIPSSNPFAGGARCNASGTSSGANCPEIYAYGFRNPWRWNFDSVSGELWLGDVGESAWEEIDKVVLGGNYGWRCPRGQPRGSGQLRPEPESHRAGGRSGSLAGGGHHRRLRVSRLGHPGPGRTLRVRRLLLGLHLEHRARYHANAAIDSPAWNSRRRSTSPRSARTRRTSCTSSACPARSTRSSPRQRWWRAASRACYRRPAAPTARTPNYPRAA